MPLHFSLDYYFRIGRLPLLNNYKFEEISSEIGCFLGIDVRLPLHSVKEMKAQSLKSTWTEVNQYVDNAFNIMIHQYGEEINSEDKNFLLDIDREILHEIENRLNRPPSTCYPIYIITVGSDKDERIVYIGKTSSKNHRFAGGHSAAIKLHNPQYSGLEKSIYFATIMLLSHDGDYMPLEFIQPYDEAQNLLTNLEAGLIYSLKPELNKVHLHKNNTKIDMRLNIENHSGISSILHGEQIFIKPNIQDISY